MQGTLPIIFYDGQCNLCVGVLGFVIRQGGRDKFEFVSLQSEKAKVILLEFPLTKQNPDSIVYLEHQKIYQRSTAVLRILKYMGKGWNLLYVFILVPRFLRDSVYNFIARNRYRWFGRRAACKIGSSDKINSSYGK